MYECTCIVIQLLAVLTHFYIHIYIFFFCFKKVSVNCFYYIVVNPQHACVLCASAYVHIYIFVLTFMFVGVEQHAKVLSMHKRRLEA